MFTPSANDIQPPSPDALQAKGNVVHEAVEKNPEFGHGMLKYWDFAPGYRNLNAGGYGTSPRVVFDALHQSQARAESAPDPFLMRHRPAELQRAIDRLESYLNAEPGTLVITANATSGTNAVIRDFPWQHGDTVLTYSSVYLSLAQTLKYVQDRARGTDPAPKVETIQLAYPCSLQHVVEATRTKLEEMKGRGNLPRLAFFDTVSSRPGVLMPFYELNELFKQYGVLTFVDGAHGIGAFKIDLKRLDADFFVSNVHKWMYAPRGNALLVVAPRNRDKVLSSVPTTWAFSWNAMWAMPGTNDFAHALSINAAIDFYERIGGQDKVQSYLRKLAIEGGEAAAKVLGTRTMRLTCNETDDDPDQLTQITANVLLPLNKDVWATATSWGQGWTVPGGINDYITNHLYDEFNTIIPIYETGGELWARISAQVFLETSDFVYGAEALKELCRRINDKQVDLPQ